MTSIKPTARALFCILLFYLISISVSASGVSSLSSAIQQSSANNTLSKGQADFLNVDEAFVFNFGSANEGLDLNWSIAKDYYLYKERFKFEVLSINGVTPARLNEARFSRSGTPEDDPYFGRVHIFQDELNVLLPITLASGHSQAEIKVTYQGCAKAGLCYPPKHQVITYIPKINTVVKDTVETTPFKNKRSANFQQKDSIVQTDNLDDSAGVFSFLERSNLLSIIGVFFLLGLGLTFTPCVFPMIPIITSIIAGQEKPTMMRSATLALSYILGMTITYAAAGVLTGMLGAGANIQAALQTPTLLVAFASIFVLLALSMFGLYELQLPAFLRDKLNNTSQNLSGGHITSVFLIGALSALVVSPCVSAPLAGALLYISSTGDALIGGASLLALGLGMGIPLFIIAIGGGKLMPKAGAWMDTIKQVFGVMLIGVAIWLLSRALPETLGLILWSVFLFVSATQLGAFETATSGWEKTSKGLGLVLSLYAAALFIGGLTGSSNALQPLEKLTRTSSSTIAIAKTNSLLPFTTIYSIDELDQQHSIAKASNKPLLLDIYADWCISCKVMEAQIFPKEDIAALMSKFHLVKADVTANTNENKKLLDKFALFGPPSILFFNPRGDHLEGIKIVGEISKSGYKERLLLALES